MKKWWIALAVVLVLLAGYGVAGPWLAIRGIHSAIERRDAESLQRYVDFPVLRANMRAKVAKNLLAAATNARGQVMGGDIGRGIIGNVTDRAVDAMVSPAGIALLLEGSALARDATARASGTGTKGDPTDPLLGAKTRFESASRFTATVDSAAGRPLVFVFERKWLAWKLSDIRLPQ